MHSLWPEVGELSYRIMSVRLSNRRLQGFDVDVQDGITRV